MTHDFPLVTMVSFKRQELKYWLPEPVAQRVHLFAAPFVEHDPAAGHLGRQRVTSLYLDTPGLDFYRWHLASAADRFKLRVRYYGDSPGDTVFFEVKRRVGRLVDKRRAPVLSANLAGLLAGTSASREATQAEHLRRFLYLMNLHRATPKLVVTCFRLAYRSRESWDKARATLDREISFQVASPATLFGDLGRWRPAPAPGPGALLELKFSEHLPWWMNALASRLARYRIAYSKYVAAMSLAVGDLSDDTGEGRVPA
jgi:hypothetical protein